tara:strand:- start:1856 stop:2059 length:204 start_codon:yes stop_codon:yes gene_type:complete
MSAGGRGVGLLRCRERMVGGDVEKMMLPEEVRRVVPEKMRVEWIRVVVGILEGLGVVVWGCEGCGVV